MQVIVSFIWPQIYKLDTALHCVQHLVLTQLVAGVAGDVGSAVVDAVLVESLSQVTTGAVLSGEGRTLVILENSFEGRSVR